MGTEEDAPPGRLPVGRFLFASHRPEYGPGRDEPARSPAGPLLPFKPGYVRGTNG